jgi:hypothetical protein
MTKCKSSIQESMFGSDQQIRFVPRWLAGAVVMGIGRGMWLGTGEDGAD